MENCKAVMLRGIRFHQRGDDHLNLQQGIELAVRGGEAHQRR